MSEDDRKDMMGREFARRFGGAPSLWARAPGRVDLMGSHTDYNQGLVLTMTVDRDTRIACRPRADRRVVIHSMNIDSGDEFALDDIARRCDAEWVNYVRGVAAVFQQEAYPLRGFDGLVHSTVPLSSGLSSSAALELATAVAFKMLGGWDIDPVSLAVLCRRAENEFVRVNCGILDQYTSALGQAGCALMLDCRSLTSRPVPIRDDIRIVICDTKAKRELSRSEYSERRAQCEAGAMQLARFYPGVKALRDVTLAELAAHASDLPPIIAKRCGFVIDENDRVRAMGRALPAGDRAAINALAAASYEGARDLYEIGSPHMAAMMTAMRNAPGVIGARQAGAGFGGCMVAFVDAQSTDAFADSVQCDYAASTGIHSAVYVVRAAPGAGPLW